MRTRTRICLLALVSLEAAFSQQAGNPASVSAASKAEEKGFDYLLSYLNMAGTKKATAFQPLTQKERNLLYGKSLVNPVWYLKGGLSAGLNQWKDTPAEWGQGASGYGRRYADIMGQYAIQKTTTFGLESLLHEDNRYFGSGKKGFWPRTGYALKSSILARHDNGKRYPSVSLITGYASGAFLSRTWQPPGSNTAGDGAASFGISMGWNIGTTAVKEFLPDILAPFTRKH
jgi:hypothetical protein